MGVDIHMYVVKKGSVLESEIFDGRNSEWFNNLQGRGFDWEYDNLSIEWGISPNAPSTDEFNSEELSDRGYYGFHHISAKKFVEWFEKYRPDRQAGWVSTYDKWRIENKGYIPEDLPLYLDKEDNINDMHFIEYDNPYDCSKWLYDYLIEHYGKYVSPSGKMEIDPDIDITYYFDC